MNYLNKFKFLPVALIALMISSNSFASSYVEDAKKFMEKGEYKAAIIQLKNQIKKDPKNAETRLLLGALYLKTGELQLADKEIGKAIRIQPDNHKIQLAYAEILLTKGEYNQVPEMLKTEFKDKQEESRRLVFLGYAYLGQNKLKQAKKYFEQSNKLQENVKAYNGLARIAISNKAYRSAEKQLQKSRQLESDNTETLLLLAKLYNFQGIYPEALKIYNKLISKDGKNVLLLSRRIETYLLLNQLDKAQKDLNYALKLYPDNIQLHYLQAQVSIRNEDYQQAQASSQRVLNVKDNHSQSQLIMGIANFGLQNYNQAEKYLSQYISLKPDNLYAQNLLANVYLVQRKPEQAILILEGLNDQQINKNINVLFTLGSAYLIAGEYEKGLVFLKKAERLQPKNQVIKKRLVEGLIKKGDIHDAISNLEKLSSSKSASKDTQSLLIVIYIQQKQLDKAEQKISLLLEKYTDDPQLYNLQAIIYKLKNNKEKAVNSYNKALQYQKDFIPAYMGLAEIAEQDKNYKQAKNYYQEAIAYKKDYIRAYYSLAKIFEQEGNKQKVEQLMIQAYNNAPDVISKVKVATTLSKIYLRLQQPEKTVSIAKELLRHYPEDIAVLSFYAGVQIANKQNSEAINTLRKIVSRLPEDINHRLLLAQLLMSSKQVREQEFLEILDEVSRNDPGNQLALSLKTDFLIKEQRYEQATTNVDDYIERFPETALAYQLKAKINIAMKQYKAALQWYQKAYKLQKKNKTLFIIADLMMVLKEGDKGIRLLLSELDKDKTNVGLYLKLASIYQQQKKLDKAINYYKQALELQADNFLALNNLAGLYLEQGNSEALELAKKAYELKPQLVPVMDTYGYAQVKMGNLSSGIQLLEKAVSISPDSYDVVYHLAEAYTLNGNTGKARSLLEPLVNKSVNFPTKDAARQLYNKL